jgi:guanylate kinase
MLLLSGPSCVGKDPLLQALARCHPELDYQAPVVHTSRQPRPGERDGVEFHFREAKQILAYDRHRYFVFQQRNQMRAIDLNEVERLCDEAERVILQLHPLQVQSFLQHSRIVAATAEVRVVAVLLQPLAVDEVQALCAASGAGPAEAVADVMRPKQIHRALQQGKLLTADELRDIDLRAQYAWDEMRDTEPFHHVLVNHDAEGSDHWRYTPPIGDAGATVARLAAILGNPLLTSA